MIHLTLQLAEISLSEALGLASAAVAVLGAGGLGGVLLAVGGWRTTLKQIGTVLAEVRTVTTQIQEDLVGVRTAIAVQKEFREDAERRIRDLEKAMRCGPRGGGS